MNRRRTAATLVFPGIEPNPAGQVYHLSVSGAAGAREGDHIEARRASCVGELVEANETLIVQFFDELRLARCSLLFLS